MINSFPLKCHWKLDLNSETFEVNLCAQKPGYDENHEAYASKMNAFASDRGMTVVRDIFDVKCFKFAEIKAVLSSGGYKSNVSSLDCGF